MSTAPHHRIIIGDVLDGLRSLPDGLARCCVTSPPYWGLRDYGVDGQIGLEPTPEAYIERMIGVFREVRRVLADDGTLWLNIGDSYTGAANSGGTGKQDTMYRGEGLPCKGGAGLKPKDLVGIPWMLAFALRADGWYLRSDIVWSKPNPMPESVTDRPTKAHEYIFLLSKRERYYYDHEAVKEGDAVHMRRAGGYENHAVSTPNGDHKAARGFAKRDIVTVGRNARSVWTIATQPYSEAHFATFPEAIPERCIKAGSAIGDTVLDPFAGSGTTLLVACRLGRNAIGCELNPEYAAMAERRIGSGLRPSTFRDDKLATDAPLFGATA